MIQCHGRYSATLNASYSLFPVRLRLNGNLFAGPVPARWAALRVLETLDLSHCKGIEGEIPSAFASMSEMKYLKLHNTNLEGPIPGFLGKLKKLSK